MLGWPGAVMLRVHPRKALFRHGDRVLGTHTLPARSFPAVEGQKPWPGRRARLFDHGLGARGNVSSAESGLPDRSISSAGPSRSSTRNGLRPAAINGYFRPADIGPATGTEFSQSSCFRKKIRSSTPFWRTATNSSSRPDYG